MPTAARGNHDGLVTCGDAEASISKQLTERLARYYFGAELYSSRNLGPHWKVVALHSMQGEVGQSPRFLPFFLVGMLDTSCVWTGWTDWVAPLSAAVVAWCKCRLHLGSHRPSMRHHVRRSSCFVCLLQQC